jgi:PhnB protein
MARVSTYLNFRRNTEEAFRFYRSVFGGEFTSGGIARLGEVPVPEGIPAVAEADKNGPPGHVLGSLLWKLY